MKKIIILITIASFIVSCAEEQDPVISLEISSTNDYLVTVMLRDIANNKVIEREDIRNASKINKTIYLNGLYYEIMVQAFTGMSFVRTNCNGKPIDIDLMTNIASYCIWESCEYTLEF